ncbi:hypothetical protein [Rhodovulum adriaticum]|uniref:Uncharacterized protein n=1 Tax=Rhodovulum adriaticum TaxID=35804 RepID=A0A4R2NW75_RHOAD|nr:hypothetical protein [Rhodovulum adriaticum]MBK1635724.1 hypothetical protein [Rhodovulum adriaticum]TCP26232.1 hypothetical protein EV656_102195 [Rhodovulum adriaticum]
MNDLARVLIDAKYLDLMELSASVKAELDKRLAEADGPREMTQEDLAACIFAWAARHLGEEKS